MPNKLDRFNLANKRARKSDDISFLEDFDPGSGLLGKFFRTAKKGRIEEFKRDRSRGALAGQKKSEKAAGQRLRQKRRRLGRRTLLSSDDANILRKTLLGE